MNAVHCKLPAATAAAYLCEKMRAEFHEQRWQNILTTNMRQKGFPYSYLSQYAIFFCRASFNTAALLFANNLCVCENEWVATHNHRKRRVYACKVNFDDVHGKAFNSNYCEIVLSRSNSNWMPLPCIWVHKYCQFVIHAVFRIIKLSTCLLGAEDFMRQIRNICRANQTAKAHQYALFQCNMRLENINSAHEQNKNVNIAFHYEFCEY